MPLTSQVTYPQVNLEAVIIYLVTYVATRYYIIIYIRNQLPTQTRGGSATILIKIFPPWGRALPATPLYCPWLRSLLPLPHAVARHGGGALWWEPFSLSSPLVVLVVPAILLLPLPVTLALLS